jgi:hypothetical protein
MLGEILAEDHGKITGVRVLPSEGQSAKVEVSFQATGQILGVDYTDLGTYQSSLTEAGVLRGKGQGVMMTKDGDTISWSGEGVGKPTGKGFAASWRGVVFYQTTSKKLANLNAIAGVFEHEVDEAGNLKSKICEWK